MSFKQNRAVILVILTLVALAWGVFETGSQPKAPSARATRRAPSERTIVVDQASLITAEQLVHMPMTAEERPFAEDALRIADNEMDLAFAQAVRRMANQPRAISDTVKEADARLQTALRALAADQARVAALTAEVSKANVATAESLNDRLNLATAQATLDQDEVDDARQDLRRAGGDPQGRMDDMIAEHDAASKSADTVRVVVTDAAVTRGLVQHVRALQSLERKQALVWQAAVQADSLADAFKKRHDRVEARAAAWMHDSVAKRLSHDSASALVEMAVRRARDGKIRAMLNQRVDNQNHLASAYVGWATVISAQERAIINRALRSLLLMFALVLVAMLASRWIEHLMGEREMRAQAGHLVARVSVQVITVLLVLLVVFGPPDNLGTMIGLAGAGLTVALKDFILGFMGWFVLMGHNGIRIGDLVEINGVTGEMVELGVFRSSLLETGHWTEAGHPTGRRVTFSNSFAVEGHYFNFSTSGRWLWDDLHIIVPAGRDPYPIAQALQAMAEEATAPSAREADAQWREARRLPPAEATGGASVSVKPIAGGVEITVRFITRVTEREALRGKLYHTAVEMLGPAKTAD